MSDKKVTFMSKLKFWKNEKPVSKDKKPKNKTFRKKGKVRSSRQLQFSRNRIRQFVTFLVFGVILCSLFFNVLFFAKYKQIGSSVVAQQRKVNQELQEVDKESVIRSDAIKYFASDFLDKYININDDKDDRDRRRDILSGYFIEGFNLSKLENLADFKGERKLKDLEYVTVDYLSNDQANIYFSVDYEITQIDIVKETIEKEVEKKSKKKKKKKKTEIVEEEIEKEEETTINKTDYYVVSVVTDGESFSVLENPAVVSLDYVDKVKWEGKEVKGDRLTTSEKESISEFMDRFFTSYGLSDEQLSYMTKEKTGLSNYVYVDSEILQSVSKDDHYNVVVNVSYKNKDTDLITNHKYYLVLSKQKNTYFVEEITQGGF